MVASHQITREWREYERSSTPTVLSAYVQPIAERYLERLAAGSPAGAIAGQLYIMQSNCGVDSLAATRAIPITMVESGPASGVWGAAELGRIIGEPERARARHRRHDRQVLADRGRSRQDHDRLLDRALAPLVRLPDHGAGGRPRRDRQWRRLDRLGRRLRQAACRTALGRRAARPGRLRPRRHRGDDDRRQSLALGRINKDYFFGGEIPADMAAVDRPRRRSPQSSASTATRRRAASSASPTTT